MSPLSRGALQRALRFEDLETRNLMAAWVAQGPFSATNGQVENIVGGDAVVGAIHAVLAHPTDANILYVGATNGGVWKTTNATSPTPSWTTNTDSQSSISIGALVFDQADRSFQTVWAGNGRYSSFGRTGGERDGLMRSVDGGASWTRVTGGGVLVGKNVSGIVANGNTIVVSVNVSDNAGNGNVGIFRSINGGATFTQVNNATASVGLPLGRSFDLVADPRNASILYTSNALPATAGGEGIYRSANGGATWTKVSNAAIDGLFANNTSNVELAAGRFGEVYAAIINAGNLAGLYRSPNGGTTWTAMDIPETNENGIDVGLNPRGTKGPVAGTPDEIAGGQGTIHFSIAADPTNANIVYVGGDRQPTSNGDQGTFPNSIGATDYSGRLFRGDASRPAGTQFVHLTHSNSLGAAGGGTASSSSPHADSRDITFDANGNLIEGDDGGVYRRTNPRTNSGDWFSINGNLQVTEMHDVAYDSVSNVIISGNQDTGTTYQPVSGANIWDSISTADGGDVVVDELALAANGQSIRYSSFQNLGAFRSTVYDASGTRVSTTFPALTVVGGGAALVPAFKTTLQANAVAGSRLIVQGSNSIYESLDQGATIREVGPGFGGSEDAIVYGGRLNGVSNPDVLWVGDGTRVALRTIAGGPLELTPSQPTISTIRDLVVDPNTYSTVAVVSSSGVSWSTDAGTSWRDITGNLGSLTSDFRALAYVPDIVGTLVAGTSQGIFATSMSALGLWFRLGTDYPNVQTYELDYDASDDVLVAGTLGRGAWSLSNTTFAIRSTDIGVEPPRLLSIAPNSGKLLDPNAKDTPTANVLYEAPNELVFRFSGSNELDPASLQGIRITRSGSDDIFGNANDIVITPTFLGFGDTNNIVIARFGETLPDDRYRIEVLGVDAHGLPAVQSIFQQELQPRFTGTDRDTFFMNLELGAKIVAIVPQPVVRLADGTLDQKRDQIEVYFNDDDLGANAGNPQFYQLILTRDSVSPNDDTVVTPISVDYDNTIDRAILTFSTPLDILAGGSGTFRLRVGSSRPVASSLLPQSPTVSTVLTDVGDTLTTASTILGTLNNQVSMLIDTTVTVSGSNQLNLRYPGSNLEPGHRDIQDETHLAGGVDTNPQITTVFYNFADGRSYGVGSNGQPLFSSITPDQKQRVREIFEFYSAQAGIDVVETNASGLTVVVGDLFPLSNPPPPFVPAGIAGGALTIMNGTLVWNNGLGESFFNVALHEIGHLLGLGHTYEQPSGTVMGSTGQLDSGNPIEFFFPGDVDADHLRHIHRPDNRDVDIYRFDVPVGQKGNIVVETIAERLADSSNVDTYLTLFKRDATGLHVVAINDNYFSKDSLIRAEVTGVAGVEYFVAVTSRGNEDYNPQINGSGSGGTSQGRYQLRFDYRPSEAAQILDTSGTAFDGDGDGLAGGDFNFWFRVASPTGVAASGAPKTVFVDKDYSGVVSNGSLANPFKNIPSAMSAATVGDVVRLVGSRGLDGNLLTQLDNPAYEIGNGGPGVGTLSDGSDLAVKKGVTLMIDAGAILKFGGSQIMVGSDDASSDRSGAAIQVLGTPSQKVVFTSYADESLGIDTNLLSTTPTRGQWGGIEIRNDVDRSQGRREPERDGIFLNFIGQADIRYGGGTVGTGSQARVVNPVHLSESRPTLLNNQIRFAGDAGISADPNSFEETLFTENRYQFTGSFTPDYNRIGPDIRGQQITNSSINGLFIRIDTLPGDRLKTLNVAGRLDDRDIVYVLGENLIVSSTPGGSYLEQIAPDLSIVTATTSVGGSLNASTAYRYRIAFVDAYGNEGLPSAVSGPISTTSTNRTISLGNLPRADSEFVGRRLYRSSTTTPGTFDLVVELDKDSTSVDDNGSTLTRSLVLNGSPTRQRARPDASLVVDPGVVIKAQNARIEVGIGAQLIAEGTPSKPVIFTSRKDDRYGAGATFDTNNDSTTSTAAPGDWSGLVGRHFSTLSIDSALITFGGGASSIPGGFASFNAIEVTQASARIANSTLEQNASGNATTGTSNRDFRGPTDASVIHVVASQPILINNVIRNNAGAAISIDANSLKATPVQDYGRSTGLNDRSPRSNGNLGPFVDGNRLGENSINGMRVRGATLTTESAWDDTDIVHVLETQIVIPDFHTYGGLRLQSRVDESLVVKLSGPNAGFTASGRPLDIPTRIGGSLQVIGAPRFPVVLTSLADDTAGAGFDWQGRPMLDTNNNGNSTGSPGDWRSVRLNPYSNDRNVDTTVELESDPVGDANRNDIPSGAQNLGTLANNLNGGDENLRLGFTIAGTVSVPSDLDVYRFTATAGTTVWFDVDRTGSALDSVVELLNDSGVIIAQSNNSFDEAIAGSVFTNQTLTPSARARAFPMNQSAFGTDPDDFQSINPLDAGFRVQLPGQTGTPNSYFVRVRSSNLEPGEAAANLQDAAMVTQGLSFGAYRLQIRLQQIDEIAGSTLRFADIRYATTGIEVLGFPGHSPLTGETAEDSSGTNAPGTAQDLGNIANSDRASISVSGNLTAEDDLDWYRFRVSRDSIQSPGGLPLGTVIDLDYSDGLGRPDTSLWVFRVTGTALRLVLVGTDSNIAEDRGTPGVANSSSDLSRGSFGPRDPFIGVQELPDGEYLIAVTQASQVEQQFRQFTQAAAANPLLRLEPISSVRRISEDSFDVNQFPVLAPSIPPIITASQVAFNGNANAVPFNLSDVTLFVSQDDQTPGAANRSRLLYANPLTGVREAELGAGLNFNRVNDIAVSPAGRVVGADIAPPTGVINDATTGFLSALDHDGTTPARVNAGIQTFEAYASAATPPVFSVTQARNGTTTNGVGTVFTALSFVDNPSANDDPVTPVNETLALFGVAQRADGLPFNSAVLGGANNALNGLTLGDITSTPFRNILYRIDPTSLLAISPQGVSDRTGDRRATGTGTEVREYGVFAVIDPTNYVWDTNNNAGGDTIIVTTQADGDIVGLAQVGTSIYGITASGQLWRMDTTNAGFSQGFRRGATIVPSALPVGVAGTITGLTRGPRNVESGAYANMLFATTSTGVLFALGTNLSGQEGILQPIFAGATTSIVATGTNALGTVNGIDFAALDVNLWHISNNRQADAGHGRPQNFDSTKNANQNGGNSLYFGYQPTGGSANAGNWNRIYQNAAGANTYDFAGGAAGAIESNPIDLRGVSVDDKPMLYFNYRSATQDSNGANTDDIPMQDAFRVYGIGPDGSSRLIATNNNSDDDDYTNTNNEFDPSNANNTDVFGASYKPQVLFDVSEQTNNPTGWRQARVPLAAFAGQNNVILRFEFSSGGSFQLGDPNRGGIQYTVTDGASLSDGSTFAIHGADPTAPGSTIFRAFEIDLGLVLSLPSGASITPGSQLTVQGRVFTFQTTSIGGPREIIFLVGDTPAQIATKVRDALIADLHTVTTNSLRPNTINVGSNGLRPVTLAGIHSVTGLDPAIIQGRPGVATSTTVGPLVLDLPSGTGVANGTQIIVEGNAFTFRTLATATGAPREIIFAPGNTPVQIATAVRNALLLDGYAVRTSGIRASVLTVSSRSPLRPVTLLGAHSVVGLAPSVIVSSAPVTAITVDQSMTAAQVRDAVRAALALAFNDPAQSANVNVWKFYRNTLQLYGYEDVARLASPPTFAVAGPRSGDTFGAKAPVAGGASLFAQESLRASNNDFEGIYVDDIIIALAERGEMVVNGTTAAPVFQGDPLLDSLLTDGGYPNPSPIASGSYQLEIRTAAEYLNAAAGPTTTAPVLARVFDSNDRVSQSINLVVSPNATFSDGATFTLSDGGNQITFEFDVVSSATDTAFGVQQGNVPIRIAPSATAQDIASTIRTVINSSIVQSSLRITASVSGEMSNGSGGFLPVRGAITPQLDRSGVIQLHGLVSSNFLGGLASPLPGLTFVRFGLDTRFGEDLGDSNRRRDQGQIIIASNSIRNSEAFGIQVDAAVRDQSALATNVGDRPYPGSARSLITVNSSNLAPGVVIVNNILALNADGILISGDNATGTASAVSNIARVYNNTLFGSQSGDRGIVVEQSATATILNNILSSLSIGITLSGAGPTTVLGANLYQSNITNIVGGGGVGTFAIQLTATDPLFLNVTNNRFYLAPNTPAIDSSQGSLAEVNLLTQVKNSVGLPLSPLIAPDRDVTGVLRIDDISYDPPAGQGQNVNIDRGAVERADTTRIKAFLVNPLDDDSKNIDADRNSTYVQLLDGNLDHFSILLSDDQGTGPDAATVLSQSVVLTENGKQLLEGVDYVFGFNQGSNTIRLTPIAGLWRRDSVYEITMLNRPSYRVDMRNGAATNDGQQVTVTLSNGTTRTIEYDSGFVIDVPVTLTAAIADGQTITYRSASGPVTTFEFNTNGDPVFDSANRIVTLLPGDTNSDIAANLAAAMLGIVGGGAFPVANLGQGRVHVGGTANDLLTVSNSVVRVTGQPGVTTSIHLQVPANGGAGIVDGQQFSIRSATGTLVTFEFDSNSASSAGTRAIVFTTTDTADVLATSISAVITASGLGLLPTSLPGGIVRLNEPQLTVVNLLNSAITSSGIAGGTIPIAFVPSSTFSSFELAAQTIRQLNRIGFGVKAYSAGDGGIIVEGIAGITGASTSSITIIRDIAGNAIIENRSNSLTQFTIVMPDVKLDYGDAPGANSQTLKSNNGARNTFLPPDAPQLILGVQIDSELDGQPNATATGDDTDVNGDDEDGVIVEPGVLTKGFFNINLPTTAVTVTSSGTGFVDAWVDWNRDGDFTDLGEQVFANQVVVAGSNSLLITSPTNAQLGLTTFRVRLSQLGNLLSGGVGVGGEVEDYQVETIRNAPPIARNESFLTLEEMALVVVSPGILANDSDADGGVLTVFDFDLNPLNGVQPSVGPRFGSLVLGANGSFTYTPNKDYVGPDSFVYYAFDSVLASLVPATVSLTVTEVNDAPEFTLPLLPVAVSEDGTNVPGGLDGQYQIADFVTGIRPGPITATSEIDAGQTVSFNVVAKFPSFYEIQPTISATGLLSFKLNLDVNRLFANGLDNQVFVTAQDSFLSPGISPTQTFSIDIAPINDAPIARGFSRSVDEGSTTAFFTMIDLLVDADGPATAIDELIPEQLTFTSVATSSAQGGVVIPTFNATFPNRLISFDYTPKADFVGIDTFTYTIIDNEGTTPLASTGTITITVLPINDAPIITLANAVIPVLEDQGSTINALGVQTQVPITIVGFAIIAPGPVGAVDEATQNLSFTVEMLDADIYEGVAGRPQVIRSLSNPNELVLTFTLKPHLNRLTSLPLLNRVRVSIQDDGSNLSPSVNSSAFATITIDIAPVNDPPIPATLALPIVSPEDFLLNLPLARFLEPNPGNRATPGPVNAIDEAGQVLSITRVDLTSARGASITVLRNGSEITGVNYQPISNFVGSDSFTYTLTDNGGGVNDSSTGTIVLNLTPVNDAPIFTPGNNITVSEDSQGYVASWATGIVVAPSNAPDELNGIPSQGIDAQTILPFDVSTTSPELFSSGPSISSTGVLSFQLRPNVIGNAVVSVRAVDSGPDIAPNSNRSNPTFFTITITPINDAPIFTAGSNVIVDEDSGSYSQPWASRIFPASGLGLVPPQSTDEADQIVSFVTSSANPALFAVAPAISATGQLTFTPALNASGSTVVTVFARDTGSSIAPNVRDSAQVTFTITLTAFNDAPVGESDSYSTTEDAPLISTANQEVTSNDYDPDGHAFGVIAGSITSSFGALITLKADGSFVYDPRAAISIQALSVGQTLLDTFTYRLRDVNGAESDPVTVTVTVSGYNDAPSTTDDSLTIAFGRTSVLDVLLNDLDVDSPIDLESLQISNPAMNGKATILPSGRISFAPNTGYRGIDSFTYRVSDNSGAMSKEATVQLVVNGAPTANADYSSMLKGTTKAFDVLDNDRDPDVGDTIDRQSVTIVSQSLDGIAIVLVNGNIEFTPNPGFIGSTTVTYTVKDNNGLVSNIGAMNVAVVETSYQNPRNRFDVNDDGVVAPIDALIVINYLNSRPVQQLSTTLPPNYLDVDGSGFISAVDILQVINVLNDRVVRRSAEGENGSNAQARSLATPSVSIPISPSNVIEPSAPKLIQANGQGLPVNSTIASITETAFSTNARILGTIDFDDESSDDESTAASVANDLSANGLRGSKETVGSVLEGVLDELGL